MPILLENRLAFFKTTITIGARIATGGILLWLVQQF